MSHFLSVSQTSGILLLCIALSLLTFCQFLKRNSRSNTFPVPPGPSRKLLVGNIHKIPAPGDWRAFSRYKEDYGDVVHFQGLGNNVLILNSLEVINDLLDKRGSNYSHRPIFTVAGELMGISRSMPLLPYGEEWRCHRKLAHIALNATAVKAYHSIQERIAAELCSDLLGRPKDFFSLTLLAAGRIVISVTYGIPICSADDEEYITHAEKTMDLVGRALVPGSFICDLIPALKYLPTWVPFQRKAIEGRAMFDKLISTPFEHVKTQLETGTANPSLTRELLSTKNLDMADFEDKVKWTTGAMYGAGVRTTYATVITFILAMALNPSKQKLAQAEIDRVIGTGRLPTIRDAPDLPYVRSVIKETMRWNPVLPLALARRTECNDVYNGFLIHKGTIVIPNLKSVASTVRGEYDPQDFVPERFLDPDEAVVDPSAYVFGFGRRICPGRYLAENSVFIIVASVLAVFTVATPEETTVAPKFTRGSLSCPEPFDCTIKPRNEAAAHLIPRNMAKGISNNSP